MSIPTASRRSFARTIRGTTCLRSRNEGSETEPWESHLCPGFSNEGLRNHQVAGSPAKPDKSNESPGKRRALRWRGGDLGHRSRSDGGVRRAGKARKTPDNEVVARRQRLR